jgi:hypothetical protein
MAIVTTYVCDVSGKASQDKVDFVEVTISAHEFYYLGSAPYIKNDTKKAQTKFIHKDVAGKLALLNPAKGADAQPEPTFESKLATLLKDYIEEIAYEAGDEAASNRN